MYCCMLPCVNVSMYIYVYIDIQIFYIYIYIYVYIVVRLPKSKNSESTDGVRLPTGVCACQNVEVRILNLGASQSGERGGSPGPPPFPGGVRLPPGRGGGRPPLTHFFNNPELA